MSFVIDERLRADTFEVVALDLNLVRLMNDRRYPWLILIPQIPGLKDLHELSEDARARFHEELQAASLALEAVTRPYKLNVAALGNVVAQLHVHVIARFEGDSAWPGPVWGIGENEPYSQVEAQRIIGEIKARL